MARFVRHQERFGVRTFQAGIDRGSEQVEFDLITTRGEANLQFEFHLFTRRRGRILGRRFFLNQRDQFALLCSWFYGLQVGSDEPLLVRLPRLLLGRIEA
jgi:hypothetical protein